MKTQIVIVAETFEQACDRLASALGRPGDGRVLQGQLESCIAVSIDGDQKVWLQQAGKARFGSPESFSCNKCP